MNNQHKPNQVKLRPNIYLYELECQDGSHQVKIKDDHVLDLFQSLHDELEKLIGADLYMIFNSFYRSKAHNKKIGGSPRSRHMQGDAGDVQFVIKKNSRKVMPKLVAAVAEKVGFDGIGVYDTFTHCDTRGYRARWGHSFKSLP